MTQLRFETSTPGIQVYIIPFNDDANYDDK
jgi:hypothetical protein